MRSQRGPQTSFLLHKTHSYYIKVHISVLDVFSTRIPNFFCRYGLLVTPQTRHFYVLDSLVAYICNRRILHIAILLVHVIYLRIQYYFNCCFCTIIIKYRITSNLSIFHSYNLPPNSLSGLNSKIVTHSYNHNCTVYLQYYEYISLRTV